MNTETQQDPNTIDGQITEVKPVDHALAVLNPTQYATELFAPFLVEVATAKRRAARTAYDISTKEGLATVKDLRTVFQKIRTGADKLKSERKKPIDQAGKEILAHYKKVEDAAKAEEIKYDAVIRAEEARIEEERMRKIAAERVRVEAIESRIAHIRSLPATLAQADSATLAAKTEELATKRLDPALYDDQLEDAVNALNTAVDTLRDLHQQALAREAEARRIAAEREELARLKAEQQKREQAEREAAAERERVAQVERLAAAEREAEQQRQLEQAKADQARQARVMEDIKAIQEIGLRDGDARALLDNLEYAKAIDITQDKFNAMMSMAQMAKDMAITSLQSKYQQRLAVELPAAHDEALAEDLAREQARDEQAYCNQRAEAEHGAFVEAEARQQPAEQVPDLIDPVAEYAAQPPLKHKAPRPTDEEIMASLVAWYGESPATIANWLLEMDQVLLLALSTEQAK